MAIFLVFLGLATVMLVALLWLGYDIAKATIALGALAIPVWVMLWVFFTFGWEIPVLIAGVTVTALALTR
jgi:hypothetical protein